MGGRGQSQGTRAPNEARGPPKEEGGAERVQDTQRTHRPIWGSLWPGDEGNGVKGCREASRGPGQEQRGARPRSENVRDGGPGRARRLNQGISRAESLFSSGNILALLI